MVNLAKRKKQITVKIPGTDVTLTVETLTQPEYSEAVGDAMHRAMQQGEIDPEEAEEGDVDLPIGVLISSITQFAHRKIVSAENVTVEGEEFTPTNEEHVKALPGQWMVTIASDLAQEATLSDVEGKDSTGPESPSTGEDTPDATSRDESRASLSASTG